MRGSICGSFRREGLVGQDVETFFAGMGSHGIVPMIFGFLAAWWPLRHEPNVMLLHYADMKRDHEGSVRAIAEFLGFDVRDEQWPAILEYTSFSWMKAHEDKFELRTVGEIPILDPGAMIRKGQVGASAEDGITAQISDATAAIGRTILTDPQAFEWCYRGGAAR